jgi:hypothetical protein
VYYVLGVSGFYRVLCVRCIDFIVYYVLGVSGFIVYYVLGVGFYRVLCVRCFGFIVYYVLGVSVLSCIIC